jgi:hypothetical protein
MRPAIVLPLYDPEGIYLPRLIQSMPTIKALFDRAIINIPPSTRQAQPEIVRFFLTDPYFTSISCAESPVGEHFRLLYTFAAQAAPPDQILHLCYIDRLTFILHTHHCQAFYDEVKSVTANQTPLIYQRSTLAWDTHPRNYREIEGMVTRVGEWLFNKTLDFAWCHMAIQSRQLAEVLPRTRQTDLSIVTEMILGMLESVHTKEVDWLAWEDPFVLERDPKKLKTEREQSSSETCKRLAYVIPMLQLLYQHSLKQEPHVL